MLLLLAASVATFLAWSCCAVAGRYDELSVEPRDRLREKRPDQQRLAVACTCGARRFCGPGVCMGSH